MGTTPTRVLIVDDREQPRRGLRAFLGTFRDMEVVGEASDGFEAVRVAREVRPDVVILDVRMPGRNGFETCKALRAETPDLGVVFLTMYRELAEQATALGHPALVKGDSVSTLVNFVRQVSPRRVSDAGRR
jgi:DNA-binding NarL/FixJ family response regulator